MMCLYGSGLIIVFTRLGSSNVVRSPGFTRANGNRGVINGFDNFADTVAASPTMRAGGLAVTSSGN
jgi:hypothetical protein